MGLRSSLVFAFAIGILAFFVYACSFQVRAATTLLPEGEQCFQQATGPVSSGSVNMYVPATTTPKTTWKDSGQVTANTNPIQLDANGCAVIFGVGTYRQQLFSGPVVAGATTGNLIFDQLTTDTSVNNVFWAGLASGTPNAITILDAGFSAIDGSVINFTALATNTSATTLNPCTVVPTSCFGAINVVKDTSGGPVSLTGTGTEIIQNNTVSVVYRATDNQFHILNPTTVTASTSSAPLCGAVNYGGFNDAVSPGSKWDITVGTLSTTTPSAVMVSPAGQAISRSGILTPSVNFLVNGAGGLDTGTIAANTWYYIFLIDNGSATSALASTSSTAPLLPSGYTFQCRVQALLTKSNATLYQVITDGPVTQLQAPGSLTTDANFSNSTVTGTCTGPTSLTNITLNGIAPTAANVFGYVLVTGATQAFVGRGGNNALVGAFGVSGLTNQYGFSLIPNPSAPQVLGYCSTSTNNAVFVYGWTDGVNVH